MARGTVLLIENDPGVQRDLSRVLAEADYRVLSTSNEDDGLGVAARDSPDAILVEAKLPGVGGLALARRLREEAAMRDVGVILLAPEDDSCDARRCRAAGVDECVSRSVERQKLLARLAVVLRRARLRRALPRGVRIERAGIEIDTNRYEVRVDGREVRLTLRELQILLALASSPGKVFTREELLVAMNLARQVTERNVDVHVRAIRKKFGAARDRIVTVQRIGYRLQE